MEQSKQILKKKSFVLATSKTVSNVVIWLKAIGIIGLLGLVLMLSVTNNYLFFSELLTAFSIIGIVGFLRFLELK